MEKAYSDSTKARTITKVLIILSYALTTLALIVLKMNSSVSHYELSIYSSISLFWVLIVFSTSIGIMTILYQVLNKNYQGFKLTFFVLVLNNFIILNLPSFRGYFLYGGNDPIGHLKRTLSIVSSGHFGDNYYPITHILGTQLITVGSISPETAIKIIPPIFSIIFMVFLYYLGTAVSLKRENALLTATASTTLLFTYYHVTVYPHAIGMFIYPLIFYAYFRYSHRDLKQYGIVLLVLLLLSPYVHAVPAAVLIPSLFFAELAKIIVTKTKLVEHVNISFVPALISLISFVSWWSSFAVFGRVRLVYEWFIGKTKEIPRTAEVESVGKIGTQKMLELGIKMYGDQLIYYGLSLIAMYLIFSYLWRKKSEIKYYFVLSVVFTTSMLTYVLIFITEGFITVGRLLGANIGAWATPALAALPLTKLLKKKKVGSLLVASILIGSFTLSVFSIYRSPWILQANWHFTYHDVSALSWSHEHPVEAPGKAYIGFPMGIVPEGSWEWAIRHGFVKIPPHFGYSNNTLLGELLPMDTVMFFGEYRQRLVSNHPVLADSTIMGTWGYPGFENNDFNRLKADQSVHIIYLNGEDDILFVRCMQ